MGAVFLTEGVLYVLEVFTATELVKLFSGRQSHQMAHNFYKSFDAAVCPRKLYRKCVFVTQLSSDAGISVCRIVWVMADCCLTSGLSRTGRRRHCWVMTYVTVHHRSKNSLRTCARVTKRTLPLLLDIANERVLLERNSKGRGVSSICINVVSTSIRWQCCPGTGYSSRSSVYLHVLMSGA